jgi:hypothetical protein
VFLWTIKGHIIQIPKQALKTVIPRFIPLVEAGLYVPGLIPLPLGILLIRHRVLHHTINLICQAFDLEVLEEH